jgi:hypothetical protein
LTHIRRARGERSSEVGVELLLDGGLGQVGPVQQLDLARQLHEQLRSHHPLTLAIIVFFSQ